MQRFEFNSSSSPTLGVEIELALINAETGALQSAAPQLIAAAAAGPQGAIKPELMQCYIEINTDVCQSVREARAQLHTNLLNLEAAADQLGIRLYWSATHPFSTWQQQDVTNDDRYRSLVNMLQDTARQLVTFGLHVHVGVDSGDKAVMICDRMLRHLPTLLAASCNSPFWNGRDTGLASWRTKIMEGLPTAGLPPIMRNWSEYVWLVNHLVDTGFIETIREIWWDIRPHHNFGTVEVRICDMPGSLDDAMAVVALIHCLVKRLSDEIDHGTYQHDCHPMMVRQNKWRAARYGLDAPLVDSLTLELVPAREKIANLVDLLGDTARELSCTDELERMRQIAKLPNWSQRQVDHVAESEDLSAMVKWLTQQSRLSQTQPQSP